MTTLYDNSCLIPRLSRWHTDYRLLAMVTKISLYPHKDVIYDSFAAGKSALAAIAVTFSPPGCDSFGFAARIHPRVHSDVPPHLFPLDSSVILLFWVETTTDDIVRIRVRIHETTHQRYIEQGGESAR